MKKIFFLFLVLFFSISYSFEIENYDFLKNKNYLLDKEKLKELYFKTDFGDLKERYIFVKTCLDFGEKFYGNRKIDACKIQFLYFRTLKNNYFGEKILQKENNFYKKYAGKVFEIQFGGDIMISRGVGAKNKKDGYDRIFKKFHPNKNIGKDVLLFYNLESPFTSLQDNDFKKPTFMFKSNFKNIKVLNDLKGKSKLVLSLANNHITNAAGEGIDSTKKILSENDIYYVGLENKILEIFNKNNKICFGAYSYDGGKKYLRNKEKKVKIYLENKIDEKQILKDLEKMKLNDCDFKIISLHWGTEYKFNPNKNQKKLAHKIIDLGADLILGHHSHILGKTEFYKGKLIYYSLGNFIFDQNWGKTYIDKNMDVFYDYKFKKKTIPTYIGNSFYHKYFIQKSGKIELLKTKNTKHRIDFGELEKF